MGPKYLTTKHKTDTNTRGKDECKNYEENYIWKQNSIVFSQEPIQENSQYRNWKNKQLIKRYSNEQHHGIKWSNLCRNEMCLWKNWSSPEEHEQRVKTWMGNVIENTGKKHRTTSKNIKTGEKYENRGTIVAKYTTRRNKSEGTGKRRKTKKILRHGQTVQTKHDTPKL